MISKKQKSEEGKPTSWRGAWKRWEKRMLISAQCCGLGNGKVFWLLDSCMAQAHSGCSYMPAEMVNRVLRYSGSKLVAVF